MKLPNRSAFTLIEMLTVMAVIAILASLIVAVQGVVQRKAATSRAEGEIKAMMAACESYKADFGSYPRDAADTSATGKSETDDLDTRLKGNPGDYQKACIVLYKAISGDAKAGTNPEPPPTPADKPDGKPETKGYFEFNPNQLSKDASGNIRFIQDPFGNSYGYSTAGAKVEEKFREDAQTDGSKATRKDLKGYSPKFDLWSTGGVVNKLAKTESDLDSDRKRWVKNW